MKIVPPPPVSLGLFLVGSFVVLGAACDKRSVSVAAPATAAQAFTLTAAWPAFVQSTSAPMKMDVLFMVDDSPSMAPLQVKLAASFSRFAAVLAALPGGTPDLHLGVVSSSMGAGRNPDVSLCPPGGDKGRLQNAPVGATCANVALTDRYLAAHADATTGALVTNFGAASLADAFSCIAPLGEQGCGFEHQMASVLRALGADGAAAPPENAGFLRPDALLAVVLVTNEDDCSAPPDSDLFDSTSTLVSDPLGPLQSYRCNEFGHRCGGKAPPRTPEAGPVDLSGTCVSAEDGRLVKVSAFATALKALKSDPALVSLAAITGAPSPYVVNWGPPQIGGDVQWPFVEHSCVAADGSYADPAVRLKQAIDAFGTYGSFEDICADGLATAMDVIAKIAVRPIAPACVPMPSAGPGCTVVDRVSSAAGPVATRVPSCADAAGATPCWSFVDDVAACGTGAQRLVIDRGTITPPSQATVVTAVDCTAPHP
jgi:hypothetical protein